MGQCAGVVYHAKPVAVCKLNVSAGSDVPKVKSKAEGLRVGVGGVGVGLAPSSSNEDRQISWPVCTWAWDELTGKQGSGGKCWLTLYDDSM